MQYVFAMKGTGVPTWFWIVFAVVLVIGALSTAAFVYSWRQANCVGYSVSEATSEGDRMPVACLSRMSGNQ